MVGNTVAQVLAALAAAQTNSLKSGTALRTPDVRALSGRNYRLVRHTRKASVFAICEELLATKDCNARLIAFDWAFRRRAEYQAADFPRFERWLYEYVIRHKANMPRTSLRYAIEKLDRDHRQQAMARE